MYARYSQLIASLFLTVSGSIMLGFGWWIPAVIVYLGAVYYLYWFAAFGPVFLAYAYSQKGLNNTAASILDSLPDPQTLGPRKQTYYWLTRARLADDKNDLSDAAHFFDLALGSSGLYEKDEAPVYLRLAQIHHLQGKDEKALNECYLASKCRSSRSIANEITQLKSQIEGSTPLPLKPVSLFDDNK